MIDPVIDVGGARGQALVVGASSTIGQAISVELAGLGFRLSLWGRDRVRMGETAAACAAAGAIAAVDIVEVTDRIRMASSVAAVTERGPLRVVVWAAGSFDWATAQEADPDTWAALVDVNLGAAAAITPMVLPALIAAAPSSLIYLGSGAAHTIYGHNAAYVASKHGLAALAHATFLDVRHHGVKVSVISPGVVAAGNGLLSPAGREHPSSLLRPEDVAAVVRFVVTFPVRGCPTEIRLEPQHAVGG